MLDLTDVTFIDTSASMAIEGIMVTATEMGLDVILIGINARIKSTLDSLGVTKIIPANHCFDTRIGALEYAAKLMESKVAVDQKEN